MGQGEVSPEGRRVEEELREAEGSSGGGQH